ncbi:MAG TPA: GNAT family N-acetyltransferase [Clostridia bacterium]|nr:GNAT family N-acetyltransferase [Clostridia bacterium]
MKKRLIELYKHCFPEDAEKTVAFMFEHILGENNVLTEFDSGKLVGAMYLVDKTLYYKGSEYPLPYIVALGTATSHRNKGYAEKLIVRSLDKLFLNKVPFVGLYPFKHSFYEKYGFFTPSYDYKLVGERVACDITKTKQIYENFCKELDYYIVRKDNFYDFLNGISLIEGEKFYEIVDNGTTSGYTCLDESVPTQYYKGVQKGTMIRIADAYTALSISNLTFDKKIKIIDNLVSGNNFSCLVKNGKVTATSDFDIALDISDLGQILFGKKTLDGAMCNALNGYLADKY